MKKSYQSTASHPIVFGNHTVNQSHMFQALRFHQQYYSVYCSLKRKFCSKASSLSPALRQFSILNITLYDTHAFAGIFAIIDIMSGVVMQNTSITDPITALKAKF